MITLRFFPSRLLILISVISFALSCSPPPTPTPFRPPTAIQPTAIPPTPTFTPTATLVPTLTPVTGPCTNELTFLEDLTVPDGTTFSPSATVDKQWLVQNDGTCDWDATYKLKWVGGYTLGVSEEQPLFPARAGVQVTLRIVFTAPAEAGTYQTVWQALDPDGNLFGDTVFMEIVVQ